MAEVHKYLLELGKSLAEFLERELPPISGTDWWKRSVLSVLTPMQLENVNRRQISALGGLDLSALLRVLDQNWYEISSSKSLPREVRNYIKETSSIRNRWAHAGTHSPPKEDTYRDLDTMQRLVQALGDPALADRLCTAKRELLFGSESANTSNNLHSVQSESQIPDDTSIKRFAELGNTVQHQRDTAPTDKSESVQVDLTLIGCVKTKLEGRHQAKQLFVSPLFIGRRARAEALGAPWFVLSAKFGLLAPELEVDTYDVSLNNVGTAERKAWSARVLEQLNKQFGSVSGKTIEIHAGASYYKFGLVQGLQSQGARVVIPLKNALLGEQLAWYNAQALPAGREKLPSPKTTNKAQRQSTSARQHISRVHSNQLEVPLQSSGHAVEVLSTQEIPPFTHRWPENVEQFSFGWEMKVRYGENIHHVRYGIGGRDCFGRYRVHTVTWLDGKPMVEGAEAEDYSTTADLVSVLKVYGGNRDAVSLEEVDPDYSNFRVVRHCDAINGPNARRGLAVRIGRDDLQAWAHHAVLRARAKNVLTQKEPVVPIQNEVESRIAVDPHTSRRVTEGLLEFDRRLAAGQSASFTPDAAADAFVKKDAFAFLVAVICDEQVRFETAWAAPLKLKQRLGHWDIQRIANEKDCVVEAFAVKPALHRWVSTTANRVVDAAARVISRYGGDASRIWNDEPSAAELRERFELFAGIGQKKSAMAVEILERALRVPLRHLTGSDVAVDVHVRRVFLRSGLAERDDVRHMVLVARNANPDRPGALDYPAWEIGRVWCRPTNPNCSECPIGAVCPRLIDRASGVRGA